MSRRRRPSASAGRAGAPDEPQPAHPAGDELAAFHLVGKGRDLVATFPRVLTSLDPPIRLPLFADFEPETARALAEGWALAASSLTTWSSIYSAKEDFRRGFHRFSSAQDSMPRVGEIDREMLERFRAWLKDPKSNGYQRDREKRTQLEQGIGAIMNALRTSERWSPVLSPGLEIPSPDRRTGEGRRGGRTPPIPDAMFDGLWVAAGDDCRELMDRYEPRLDELERTDGASLTLAQVDGSPARLAAYLLANHPDLPNWSTFQERPAFKQTPIAKDLFGEARDLLLPPISTVIPPMIIVATIFALNPSTLKGIKFEADYRFEKVGGRERVRIFPNKPRAKDTRQRNSVIVTDDPDNPGRCIRFVERITSRLRERAAPGHQGKLFLWLSAKDGQVASPRGFDMPITRELKKFRATYKLTDVQLNRIRPTTLDRVHRITGGDLLKVKAVANHASVDTTATDYKSAAMRGHELQSLGSGMQQVERRLRTGGRVDAGTRAGDTDRASATPGYACLDPLDSPILEEREGLCGAYGRCPICPLATVQHTPEAYRYLLMLLERIDGAKTLVGGVAWLTRWAPVRRRLVTKHLRGFPRDVRKAAANLSVPPLPDLE